MTELNRSLRRSYAVIARRRVPEEWLQREPALADFEHPTDLVRAIRDDTPGSPSDTLVRSMVRLATDHPDAALVLTEALAPRLFAGMLSNRSYEFREAVLLDLVCVILEATELDKLDQLARRLAHRASERSRRDWTRQRRRYETEVFFNPGIAATIPGPSVEEEVVSRTEFEAVREVVNGALASGELSTSDWETFRAGSIEPRLGFERPDIHKDVLYRRARKVRNIVEHAF